MQVSSHQIYKSAGHQIMRVYLATWAVEIAEASSKVRPDTET